MPRQCILKCLLDSHAPIKLLHNAEIIIGRSKLTKIKDQSCSRKQISLKADCNECKVELKQLGLNPSGLDGFALKKNETYKVGHGSRIEVVLNSYIHVIEFDPPPEGYEEPRLSSKRKLEEKESPIKKKILKTENSKDMSSIAVENIWEEIDNGQLYIFTAKGVKSSKKIAAFDMDGTLIKTKSGKVYPIDTNDWQLNYSTVSSKLKEYCENGFKIVILTNQAPIGNGKVKIEDFKKKIEALVVKLDVPTQVYIATGKGFYRKPLTGMWKTLEEKKNDSIKIDMKDSFYCGDAVGRTANWAPGKKKDHSMADKLMAENLGLTFFTPEQFFLGHSIANVPISKPDFIPHEVKSEPFNDKLISQEKEAPIGNGKIKIEDFKKKIEALGVKLDVPTQVYISTGKGFYRKPSTGTWKTLDEKILVLVGYPGSGKSFIAKQIEKKSGHQYAAVCRDVLGSWQKCAAEAKSLLSKGKSVIVDSTNPDAESRGRWTSLAKEMNVICRCAKMTTTKAHAQHNNKFRELMKIKHVPVSDIVFHSFKNKFSEPKQAEGFKEIIEVKFNPAFEDEEAENLYRMHLLEK